jgi:urease accessory protein
MGGRMNRVAIGHQRVDGAARLAVRRAGDGASRIAELYQRAPVRLLFPDPPAGEPPHAVLLTTSGGLTGGDRLAVTIAAGPGAAVVVSAQAAEKIYPCDGVDCTVGIGLSVAEAASAEWLMQETILFDGASLCRRVDADVAPSGRLLAVESLIFGRRGMGEDFARGRIRDSWRVRRGSRLVWADALAIDAMAEARSQPFGFGDAVACATVVEVASDTVQRLDMVRGIIAASPVAGGATAFDGLLVARLVAADAQALRAAVVAVTAALRGGPMPRVWSC